MTACPITKLVDCRSRKCELHYMDAPLRLQIDKPIQGPLTEEQLGRFIDIGVSLLTEAMDRKRVTNDEYDEILRDTHAMVMETFELDLDDHSCNTWSIEVDTIDCGYCCKVMRCEKCGKEFDSHRKIYGCPQG